MKPGAAHSDSYDPFGTPDQTQPADSTVHGYVAADNKQTDTTNNLILMGARPYDPTLGRFLTIDPIDGGSPNNYDYTAQNPINNTDPSGEMPIDPGAIADGNDFEDEVISAFDLPENNELVEADGNRAKPDAMSRAASIEIKHGAYVYASKQLRTEAAAAKSAGQEFDLIVGPGTRVSGPAQELVENTGGRVLVYRPTEGTLSLYNDASEELGYDMTLGRFLTTEEWWYLRPD